MRDAQAICKPYTLLRPDRSGPSLRPFAAVNAHASRNTSAYIATDSIACQKARKD